MLQIDNTKTQNIDTCVRFSNDHIVLLESKRHESNDGQYYEHLCYLTGDKSIRIISEYSDFFDCVYSARLPIWMDRCGENS